MFFLLGEYLLKKKIVIHSCKLFNIWNNRGKAKKSFSFMDSKICTKHVYEMNDIGPSFDITSPQRDLK